MNLSTSIRMARRFRAPVALAALFAILGNAGVLAANPPNACPVDGCEVRITGVKRAGAELALTFEANFTPDLSKNHLHVWWGELYTVEQVSDDAEPVHKVTQGDWHLTDDYPAYTTQGAASPSARGGARRLCVSAADRNHIVIDVTAYHCVDVGQHL